MYLISDLTEHELVDEDTREDLVAKNSHTFNLICEKIESLVGNLMSLGENPFPSDEENVWEWYEIATTSGLNFNISHAKFPLPNETNPIKILIESQQEIEINFISDFCKDLSKEFNTKVYFGQKKDIP